MPRAIAPYGGATIRATRERTRGASRSTSGKASGRAMAKERSPAAGQAASMPRLTAVMMPLVSSAIRNDMMAAKARLGRRAGMRKRSGAPATPCRGCEAGGFSRRAS